MKKIVLFVLICSSAVSRAGIVIPRSADNHQNTDHHQVTHHTTHDVHHGDFSHDNAMASDEGFRFSKEEILGDVIMKVNLWRFQKFKKDFRVFSFNQLPIGIARDSAQEKWHATVPWVASTIGVECEFNHVFGGELTTGIGFGGEYRFSQEFEEHFVPRAQLIATWIGGKRVPIFTSFIAGYNGEFFLTGLVGMEPFQAHKKLPGLIRKSVFALRYNTEDGSSALIGYPLGRVIILAGAAKNFAEQNAKVNPIFIAKIDL